MIKGSINQDDIAILNMYAPKNRTLKYVKQKLTELKGERDNSTIILQGFNTCLSDIDRNTSQKFSKNIENVNNIIQNGCVDIYKIYI